MLVKVFVCYRSKRLILFAGKCWINHWIFSLQMSHVRRRLGSVGDSAPPSDSSEGSEICEAAQDWSIDPESGDHQANLALRRVNGLFIHADSNPDDSIGSDNSGILGDSEKAQVESFFSGLGTEVRY